ncbi:MAG TPA: formate dehydrogenase accessory sulfurtransferase FdhD [Stellaceae bacterium]|nr:formate dehydrogenase accessory sulfurtransferase FdhD [Stellaceae bacterium]
MSAEERGARRLRDLVWRHGDAPVVGERALAEETPISLSYRGCSYAVMMATPADLVDFGYGFSLTEGVISDPREIRDLEVRSVGSGVVIDMELVSSRMDAFWDRRRHLAGPVGCGLCGIDSIAEALRPCPAVAAEPRITSTTIAEALAALEPLQVLNRATHAVHAAAFWHPGAGLIAVREDVGRHNALDKLLGGLVRQGVRPGSGIVLLTSRISLELVQKAAMAGVSVVVAISAPTVAAVRLAEAARITLVGVARHDGFEVLTHPRRIVASAEARVA